MKLATGRTGAPDGQLFLVSRDLRMATPAADIAATLQDAIDRWDTVHGPLAARYDRLNAGALGDAAPFAAIEWAAPLPRAWQWLDASAFPSHGVLLQQAYGLPPIPTDPPLMYQGMSHRLLGPADDVALPSEDHGIDFEAEFGIITGPVAMGATPPEALTAIRLAVLINDWSLRNVAAIEMRTGFGWLQGKPACSLAPVAVTPDELGTYWADGRLTARMQVHLNGTLFGDVPADTMQYGFHQLIAHAARTRDLCAGTLIGSGTVSSPDAAACGSCCIAERRAIETIANGAPITPFLKFGDQVRITARLGVNGAEPFGRMDQRITQAVRPG